MIIEIACEGNQAFVTLSEPVHNFPIGFQFMDRTSKILIRVKLNIESFKHFIKTLKEYGLDNIEEKLALIEHMEKEHVFKRGEEQK